MESKTTEKANGAARRKRAGGDELPEVPARMGTKVGLNEERRGGHIGQSWEKH